MPSATQGFNLAGKLTMQGGEEFAAQLERGGRAMQRQGKYAEQAAKSLRLFAVSLVGARIGQALTAMGRAMVDFTKESVQMAFDWETSMRKVRTQTELTGTQFQRISNEARSIASKLPFAFEEVSSSLYDIYSGTRLVGIQGTKLLEQVGNAAVAGGADISVATDATIGAVNSFKLSIKDVPHLLDLQFQLVRKAKGDYQDYANVLNNVYPSARRFGQSLEQTYAAVSFASKGVSASPAQAVISVARAMDQLGRAKNAANMVKELGVNVYNAQGQTRPMITILEDMATALDPLTEEQRAQKLYEVFGVGGIQANRFLNQAIPGIAALKEELKGFADVEGLVARAHEIMVRNNPEIALEILTNRAAGLRMEFAARLFPAIQDILGVGDRLLNLFENLSPAMKDLVAKTVAFGGILLLVSGRVLTFTASIAGARSMMILTEQTWSSITRLMLKDIALMARRMIAITIAIGAIVVAIRWMTDNWEKAKHIVATLGAVAVIVFRTQIAGAVKFAIFAIKYYAVVTAGAIVPTGGLAAAARGLGLAIKSALGPFALIFIAIESLMAVYNQAKERQAQFAANVKELVGDLRDGETSVDAYREKIDRLNTALEGVNEQGGWFGRIFGTDMTVAERGLIQVREQHIAAVEKFTATQAEQARVGFKANGMTVRGFREASRAARDQGVSVKGLRDDIQVFAGMTMNEMKEWEKSIESSLDLVGNALSELGDESKITADKFIAQLRKQMAAARNFLRNLQTAARLGLTEQAAVALEAMGSVGQVILADAVKNGRGAVKELNNVLIESGKLTGDWKQKVTGAVQGAREKNKEQLDKGGEDIRRYIGQLSAIPGDKYTRIHVESSKAEADVKRLLGLIAQLRNVNLPVYPGKPTFSPHTPNHNDNWRGGTIREPVFGVGMRSGETYSFGERGPEDVVPRNRNTASVGAGRETHLHFHGDGYVDPEKAIAELIWYDKTHPLIKGGPS